MFVEIKNLEERWSSFLFHREYFWYEIWNQSVRMLGVEVNDIKCILDSIDKVWSL